MNHKTVLTRTKSMLLGLLAVGAALFIATFLFSGLFLASETAEGAECGGNYFINQSLPSGGSWEICWASSDQEGIILYDIHYVTPNGTRRKVLKTANLAQIFVPYDDNSQRYHYVSDQGLGGTNLLALTGADCPNGTLLGENGKNLICQQIIQRGFLYKYGTSAQKTGYQLELFSVSRIGSQNFVVMWKFYDDGTIEPTIGHSGELEAYTNDPLHGWALDDAGTYGTGFTNNYYWRLDFDIADNGANDMVEEIEIVPASNRTRKEMSTSILLSETGRSVNADLKRSWRVRDGSVTNADGHAISYHLEPLHAGHDYAGSTNEPWTNNDIYFTTHDSCERFVSKNPTSNGCGADVTEFVNGQNINGADVVVWYGITLHRLPKNEDEPVMPIRWDGFKLVPRDWTAQTEF